MPPRPSRSVPEIVEAALRYVDEHGLDALTLRVLGERLGLHHTALYRYFPSRGALVSAMIDRVFADALHQTPASDASLREQVLHLGLSVREVLKAHPNLLVAIAENSNPSASQNAVSMLGARLLEQAGLEDENLVRWHSVFEGYIVGATLFDFSGAPNHYLARAARYQGFNHPAFARSAQAVEILGDEVEAAFRLGLEMLIDRAFSSAGHGDGT